MRHFLLCFVCAVALAGAQASESYPYTKTSISGGALDDIVGPQFLESVRSIAQSLQPHTLLQKALEWSQLFLTAATVGTLIALIFYTCETKKLRIATQDQVNATNKLLGEEQKQTKAAIAQIDATNKVLEEARVQNSQALMPIIVLKRLDEPGEDRGLELVNMGKGPAFNVRIQMVEDLLSKGPEATVSYLHVALAAGAKQHFPPALIRIVASSNHEVPLPISYSGSDGKTHRTLHCLRYEGRELRIDFKSFAKDV